MSTNKQPMVNVGNNRRNQPSRAYIALIVLLCVAVQNVAAQTVPQTRLVVRDGLGLNGILNLCGLLRCSTTRGLGDPQGQLFMIAIPAPLVPVASILLNVSVLGLVSVEVDQTVRTQGAYAGTVPAYLSDRTPYNYYGTACLAWLCLPAWESADPNQFDPGRLQYCGLRRDCCGY